MIQAEEDFLRRTPIVIGDRNKEEWLLVGRLQRQGLVRLEWTGTRIARICATEAGNKALRKKETV